MKKIIGLLALAMVFASGLEAQKKSVDVNNSSIVWTGKKVTGEHTGNIKLASGTLQMDGKTLKGGEFVVDMNTITCTDLKNEDYNAKLVGHLKSDDFFGVEQHPYSKLTLSKLSKEGNSYQVKGDLTIKGQTHPVSFEVKHSGHVYEGKLIIDRTKYNVRYGSGKFFDNLGDKMIYDDFELHFKVMVEK